MAYFETTKLKDEQGQVIGPAENSILRRILYTLMSPLGFDRSLNRQRSTAIIESGTVTTVTTVTTCSTVTNLTNIGGYNGAILMNGANYTAWATTNRNLIT